MSVEFNLVAATFAAFASIVTVRLALRAYRSPAPPAWARCNCSATLLGVACLALPALTFAWLAQALVAFTGNGLLSLALAGAVHTIAHYGAAALIALPRISGKFGGRPDGPATA